MDDTPANPKHANGTAKLPTHLVPSTAIAVESLAFLEGYLKYGYVNWRATKVYASIYIGAARRHLALWFEGEECDPKTHVSHLGYARACLGIIIDARAYGMLIDDRPIKDGYADLADALTPTVAHLHALFGEVQPRHYTRANEPAPTPVTTTVVRDAAPRAPIGVEWSLT